MASLGSLSVTVGAAIDGFERSMGTVSQRLNAIDREATKAFSGFEKVGDRLTTIGAGLSAAITLPLLGAAVAATKFATDFELGMRQVTSLLGGATKQEFDALSKRTLDLARAMGIDAVKASNALYEAISAGVPKENAIDFLAVASKAAIAGVTDTKVAVDGLTSIINAYGLDLGKAKDVSDAMFQSVNLGKFTFEQLAGSISIATPLAAQLGVGFRDLLAAAATLTSQGYSVTEAMTSIRSAMVGIVTPNKAMNALLEQTGFASGQALIETKGLQGSLEALRTAAGGNVEVLTTAIGRVEGLGAVLGLTGAKADTARGHLNSLRDSTGAADKAFQEIDKTTERQFVRLTSELKVTAIELGTALLPAVNSLLKSARPLVDAVAEAVRWFTTLSPPVQTAALAIAGMTAALGPVIFFAGQAVSGFASMAAAITASGGVLVAFSSLAAAIPYVAAALVAFLAVWATWEFRDQLLGVQLYIAAFNVLTSALGFFVDVLKGVAQTAATVGTAIYTFLQKPIDILLIPLGLVVDAYQYLTEKLRQFNASYNTAKVDPKPYETLKKKLADLGKTTDAGADFAKVFAKNQKDLADQLTKTGKGAEDTGKKHKEAALKAREFSDVQPVLAARIRIVEGEYKKNVEELARLQLALERGQIGSLDMSAASEKLAADIGHLGTAIKDLPQLPGFTGRIPELEAVGEAYRRLGITTTGELKRIADAHLADFNTIKGSGIATAKELETAWLKWLEAAAEAATQAGEEIPIELEAILATSTKRTKEETDKQKTIWEGFGTSVSTVITNFAQDISKSLWDGDTSWGQKGKDLLKSLGQSVTSLFIEPATAALSKFITGVLADLIGGKGFGGVIQSAKDLGTTIAGVFGGGAQTATTVAGAGGAAGTAAGGAGSAGGVAGSAAGAATSSVTGILTAVGSLVSAAGSIAQFVQGFQIEKGLDDIEHEVRFSQIHLKEILGRGVNEFLSQLPPIYDLTRQFVDDHAWRIHDVWGSINNVHDLIAFDTNSILSEIRDSIRAPRITAPLEGVTAGGGNTYVTIQWSANDPQGYRGLLSEIQRNLR